MTSLPSTSRPPANDRLFTGDFALLLAMMACFGMSWSFYLILPKFLATELSLDAAGIGKVVGVQGLTAVMATPLVGWLVDRYGRLPWLVAGNVMLMLTGIAYVFVEDVGPLLYFAQMMWGMGMVMTFNSAGTMTADIAPKGRMAEAIGFFGAANLAMNAVSPAIGEVLESTVGWDYVFIASATAGALAAVLGTFLKEPPKHVPHDLEERRPILGMPMLRVYGATLAITASFTALFTLHQPYALGEGVTQIRSFFVGFAILALTVRLGGGRLIDRFGVLRASIVSVALYATVPPLLGLVGPTHLFLVGAAMGLAHGVAYPALTALGIARASASSRGMVVSIVHGAFNGGHAFFAYTLGMVAASTGYPAAFWIAGAVTFGGALLLAARRAPAPARLGAARGPAAE
ncbi:MAG: MFS transporter [Myxococcales bacterium]|nr:MFS transporter [Myxococcales bacterium]MDH3484644.1 MFS transporter [Myxococcales bacterium]